MLFDESPTANVPSLLITAPAPVMDEPLIAGDEPDWIVPLAPRLFRMAVPVDLEM